MSHTSLFPCINDVPWAHDIICHYTFSTPRFKQFTGLLMSDFTQFSSRDIFDTLRPLFQYRLTLVIYQWYLDRFAENLLIAEIATGSKTSQLSCSQKSLFYLAKFGPNISHPLACGWKADKSAHMFEKRSFNVSTPL